mgnify:CR=1 FL=1|tara:strand:- start:185 stop:439 length:255 start_codon:yes stop_codon:yes gene_type:complete
MGKLDNRHWAIITLSNYTDEQLQELVDNAIQTSVNTLRKSTDKTLALFKWDGDTPSVFDGMTTYNHTQILTILKGSDWTSDEGE